MPAKKTKSKSRTAKSSLNKLHQFKFRWWMALILIAVVAGLGVIILRFSRASATRVFSVGNGLSGIYNASTVPANPSFTAYSYAINVANRTSAEASDTYGNIVSNNDVANIDRADVEVCWVFYKTRPDGNAANYYLLILDWGGNEVAVTQGTLYAQGTTRQCIRQTIGAPNGNLNYFYRFLGANENQIDVVSATRTTLAVYPKVQAAPGPNPVGGSNPAPPGNPNIQTLNFPAGQLTTVCGYEAVAGYASVCPQNINQWSYIGLLDDWVGTWAQNQARGVTTEHDVGYWKWGNFCAVKSRVIGEPRLTKVDESNGVVHFYLVGCPTANSVYSFKLQNRMANRPAETPRNPQGRLYITKYGPNGPVPPNGYLKSNPGTAPGNTGICIKNRGGVTFACGGSNPFVANGIFVSDNPYQAYTTAPAGWKITRVMVNGVTKYAGNIPTAFALANAVENQNTFIDFYYDRQ
ncbi:hypothetical protein HYX70_01710 [Candidatus Saccharibacteria bacterium]|nr:hypothetical protein [Candidatus Saccharibacteria bacterium]